MGQIRLLKQFVQKNLKKVKGLVDNSTSKRNIDISDYLYRRNSYRQVRNQIKSKLLTKQNQKIVQRLTDISDRRRNETRQSVRSNQSMRSIDSQISSIGTRKAFQKKQEIQQQNNKISERIKKAHFRNGLGPKDSDRHKKQNKSYKKVHSRFSQRSQSQMKQILNGLKYDQKKIPFLPVVVSRRYSKY